MATRGVASPTIVRQRAALIDASEALMGLHASTGASIVEELDVDGGQGDAPESGGVALELCLDGGIDDSNADQVLP